MLENQFVRFDPTVHKPEQQCPINHANFQCPYLKEEGKDYCPRHIGRGRTEEENKKIRLYRLGVHKARVEEFADSQGAKSIREEIGILRLIMEAYLLKCSNATDLLIQSQQISNLAGQIEKLVTSCHKLEQSTKFLIDKPSLIQLAARILVILEERIDNPELLDLISQDLIQAIAETGNDPPESST